ncbi:hypothetical protein ACEN88_16015 [Massilia sp. CT11-108]|uniref:hypothetical protein n=1 Tax=Massilia sp. CT11-108 TaxID=3393900 RepID=UPI0039A5B0BC
MNKRFPTRKQAFAILIPLVITSILLQVFLGWDWKAFCLSLLINTLAAGIVWRYRTPVAVTSAQHPRAGVYSFVARAGFWVVVAVILFFGFKRFQ